jgi:hypothetical protein
MAAALAVAGSLTGCGNSGPPALTVSAPTPAPTKDVAAVCAALLPALPTKVDDLSRRPVQPDAFAAAWGENPTVVLRCGVPVPREFTRTSTLTGVNEVDWFLVEQADALVFTTIGRRANVEITIPRAHEPTVGPLVDVADAMRTTNPTLERSN